MVSVVLAGVSVVSVGVSVVSAGVFVVAAEVSVVSFMFLFSLRQVSIRSGLLFSSTVGMLQPLSRI